MSRDDLLEAVQIGLGTGLVVIIGEHNRLRQLWRACEVVRCPFGNRNCLNPLAYLIRPITGSTVLLSQSVAEIESQRNDLPNSMLVIAESRKADFVLRT